MLISSIIINLTVTLFFILNILLAGRLGRKYILFLLVPLIWYSAFRDEGFNHDTYSYNNYVGDALESRLELVFRFILHYSSSILEFNLVVAILKSFILILIVRTDKNSKLQYFWIYYLLCYQLMFDYTTVRYSLAIFIVVYGIRLYETNKFILGRFLLFCAPLFHYSTFPIFAYIFQRFKIGHFFYLIFFVLGALFFWINIYGSNLELILSYLETRSGGFTESSFKIYKTIFDIFFVLYFFFASGLIKEIIFPFFFLGFSIFDFLYPGLGLNRIRILFEILILIRFSESVSGKKNVRIKILMFIIFVLSRGILSVYDFSISSF